MAKIVSFPKHKTYAEDALEQLENLVAEEMAIVNKLITYQVKSRIPLISKLALHLIASGGKRLRSMLTLACARLCGYKGDRHLQLAACMEFIHTATLLHDDVVDDSAFRRGNPSANVIFGNKASVLVGDFLFSRAFQLVVEDGSLEILRILSRAAAVVAEGEVLQLTAVGDSATSEQTYLDIISAKTGELFAAACCIGAVVAESSTAEKEALRTFGLNFGIAYQIVDDVLDYSAEKARLGKEVGNDFREGKVTLPIILAMHRGSEDERNFWRRTFDGKEQNKEDFSHACVMLRRCNALHDSIVRARHYATVACEALGVFRDCPAKKALLDIATFAVAREF